MNNIISVFEYMDISLFLQSYYNQKKISDPQFTYSLWARQIGFKNKTILRMILQKKRTISTNSLAAFQTYFNFCEIERNYFEALVHYSQSKNSAVKQTYGSLLIKIQRQNFHQKIFESSGDSGLLFDVYSSILYTIISSAESPISIENIQKHCGLTQERIGSLIHKLMNFDLIVSTPDGYTTKHKSFKIADSFQNKNMKNYYKFWLEKSSEAIELPFEVRRFRSLQIALTESEFNEIVQKTNDFASQLLSHVQTNSIEDRKLYLLNTALFPVKDVSI